jgi:threonine dehydrogenase-like Zn-dependent dehydrogenase
MRGVAVFPKRREVRIIEVPSVEIADRRDVLVRVRQVGICGTDREICAFHYGQPPPGSDALVLGHEALGEVLDVGPGVEALKPGDLVALTVRRPCTEERCEACRAGRQDFCVSGHFRERGIKEMDGFMTERVVEQERYLVRVPKVLADVGVLVEPLSIAAKAAVDLDRVLLRFPWERTGLRALVLGAGPIGLLAAMMLTARNLDTVVYSLEPSDSPRARLVGSIGARYASAAETKLPELSARGHRFDVMFEAVGTARVAFAAINELEPNGVCILSGVPGASRPIEIDLDTIMRNIVLRNQVLFGTVNASRAAFEASVRQLEQFMALFPESVRGLITERVPLTEAPALLKQPVGGGSIKQVVTLSVKEAKAGSEDPGGAFVFPGDP